MAPSESSAPQKRKQRPPSQNASSRIHRAAKRVKTYNARSILTQHSDKALSKDGELDVSAFVKSREFEIKAMGASMGASNTSLSTRAFQQVPMNLRRRTASHNVKRVPRRLRLKAAKEMKEDNTPTMTSLLRKPTTHQRLRLEKTKALKKLGASTKRKRDVSRNQKADETNPVKMVPVTSRIPRIIKDTLLKPNKPTGRFRKRQIHKSWLPTHLYHAKRAHMTPPNQPLWRFAIPLTPTDKCYRATHRATSSSGCVAWDTSYTATIGVDGVESSLVGLLRSVGVDGKMLAGKREVKWRRGTRWWEGWIRERDGEKRWIAKVGIVWCLDATAADDPCIDGQTNENVANRQPNEASGTDIQQEVGAIQMQLTKQEPKATRRKLLIRVHPSAFFQTWNEILKVAKIQRPVAAIEDLRFDIGSIEITGPESTQALIGVLHQLTPPVSTSGATTAETLDDGWIDVETPEQIWPRLSGVTNPASLPLNAILGFNVSDPRLHHPPRTIQAPHPNTGNDTLLELISSWSPDQTHMAFDIFDRRKRFTASRQLSSQKAINRRKGEALPGAYPASSPKDPKIPVLLMVSRTATISGQGSWTVLLPWDCVLPVWYTLMHYPLASGGNPRFGGLHEKRQITFEQGVPWFPADYPGTNAGFEWELSEREKRKQEWEKRPKAKRTAWESVDLGNDRKGEVGLGWACDWERLLQEPLPPSSNGDNEATAQEPIKAAKQLVSEKARAGESSHADPSPTAMQPSIESSRPPLGIHHLVAPRWAPPPSTRNALSPIHLTLIASGHPARNARIYRLPTTNGELREKWLTLVHPARPPGQTRPPRQPPALPRNAGPYERAQGLAASFLLLPLSHVHKETIAPKAGDPSYPAIPDEVDLIGFVTTGNYHLGEGKYEAIGNVAVTKVMGEENKQGKGGERNLCIVRDSGQSIGRLARWKFV